MHQGKGASNFILIYQHVYIRIYLHDDGTSVLVFLILNTVLLQQ